MILFRFYGIRYRLLLIASNMESHRDFTFSCNILEVKQFNLGAQIKVIDNTSVKSALNSIQRMKVYSSYAKLLNPSMLFGNLSPIIFYSHQPTLMPLKTYKLIINVVMITKDLINKVQIQVQIRVRVRFRFRVRCEGLV